MHFVSTTRTILSQFRGSYPYRLLPILHSPGSRSHPLSSCFEHSLLGVSLIKRMIPSNTPLSEDKDEGSRCRGAIRASEVTRTLEVPFSSQKVEALDVVACCFAAQCAERHPTAFDVDRV